MRKYILTSLLLLCSTIQLTAQRLQITRFVEDQSDLKARQESTGKKDINGDWCGLIRVQFVGSEINFESKSIKEIEKSTSEYLVWMNRKSKKLTIKVPGFLPLNINFKNDYGLKEGIQEKTTYIMVIEGPQDSNAGHAYLTFLSNNGEGCQIKLNGPNGFSQTYTTDKQGKVENLNLPYGEYRYTASKQGFHTNSGTVTLSGAPVTEQIDLNSVTGRLNVKVHQSAKLYVDNKEQPQHHATLATGHHKVEVRDGQYSRSQDIDLPSSGLELDMNLLGQLTVTNPKGATLKVVAQNGAQQLNRNDFTVGQTIDGLLGKYKVTASKRGFESGSKTVEIKPASNLREAISLRRIVEPYGFVNYYGSPKSPIGLMFGTVKRWGWYVAGKGSPNSWSLIFSSKENGSVKDATSLRYRYHHELKYPTGDVDYSLFTDKGTNQWDITSGVMCRLVEVLYLFAGAGYGVSEKLYIYGNEDSNDAILFTDQKKNGQGPVGQAGLMLRIGKFNLLGGCDVRMADKDIKVEPIWGLGFSFYLSN